MYEGNPEEVGLVRVSARFELSIVDCITRDNVISKYISCSNIGIPTFASVYSCTALLSCESMQYSFSCRNTVKKLIAATIPTDRIFK